MNFKYISDDNYPTHPNKQAESVSDSMWFWNGFTSEFFMIHKYIQFKAIINVSLHYHFSIYPGTRFNLPPIATLYKIG